MPTFDPLTRVQQWAAAPLALLLLACTPPVLQLGDPALLRIGSLAFLQDGRSTREEVLLNLGTPSAHFEGDRILTYALWKSSGGTWIRQGRGLGTNPVGSPPAYTQPTDNLVLVFDANGVLTRHNLVVAR